MAQYFEVSGSRIAFPEGVSDLETAKRTLSMNYPMLRNTTIYPEDAKLVGEDLVFPVFLPPAKTKG